MTAATVPVPLAPVDIENDNDIVNYALKSRLAVSAQLVADNNGNIPQSEERLNLYMTNLNGIEKLALTRMRIKADEKANQTNAELTAAIVTGVLKKIQPNDNPFVEINPRAARPAPQLPEDLPELDVVPGQMEIGANDSLNIDSFMDSFKKSEQ